MISRPVRARVERRLKAKAKRKAIKKTKSPSSPAVDPRIGVKPTICPGCGYKNDAATAISDENARPEPGAFCICLNCSKLLIFDEECEPVLALPEDIERFKTEAPDLFEKVTRISNVIKEMAATGVPIKDRKVPEFKPIRTIARVDWGHIPGAGEGPFIKAEGAGSLGFAVFVMCQAIRDMSEFPEPIRAAAEQMCAALNPRNAKEPPMEIYRGKGDSA